MNTNDDDSDNTTDDSQFIFVALQQVKKSSRTPIWPIILLNSTLTIQKIEEMITNEELITCLEGSNLTFLPAPKIVMRLGGEVFCLTRGRMMYQLLQATTDTTSQE